MLPMSIRLLNGYACALILVSVASAKASIIVDHQPEPGGGLASDTLFTSPFGQTVWQQVADDFVWTSTEQLVGVNFWGFYNADNPPAIETFRLRFYSTRSSDGLPGDVVYEEMLQNPSRSATGRIIQTGIGPREFLFETNLKLPVDLTENVMYWFEVVQIGDITTYFRWEHSINADFDGVATANIIHTNWQSTFPNGPADAAFQLISPEPAAAALLVIAFFVRTRSRRTAE